MFGGGFKQNEMKENVSKNKLKTFWKIQKQDINTYLVMI